MAEVEHDEEGNVVVPGWVDGLVDKIAQSYLIVAGPARSLILGRAGENSMLWTRADDMRSSVLGDYSMRINGPYKNAILTRLRQRAHKRVGVAPLVPRSVGCRLVRHSGGWYVIGADGEHRVASIDQAPSYDVHWIEKLHQIRRMGVCRAGGEWLRVTGVIADGDPAYAGFEEDPLKLLIPCPPGAERHVIFMVEQVETGCEPKWDVYGLTVGTSLTSGRAEFSPFKRPIQPSYFPYRLEKDGKVRWICLKLPD